MENSISIRIQNHIRIFCYLLAALSITSCIVRNDYNVVFSFLILAIINKFYSDNPKFFSKILFQLLLILVIIDIVWISITLPYWSSDSSTHTEYWDSLSGVHTLAIILSFIEIFIKVIMSYLLFDDYQIRYKNVKHLFTFKDDLNNKLDN